MISFTRQIALVVLVPLFIELYFLFALLGTLAEVQKERKAESVSIKSLAAINLVLNDVVKCGNLLLFHQQTAEQEMAIEANFLGLIDHTNQLKGLLREEKLRSSKIRFLVAALDKLIDTCQDMEHSDLDNLMIRGPVIGNMAVQINQAGALAIEDETATRARHTNLRRKHETELEDIVRKGSLGTLAIATILGGCLLWRFSFALGRLMDNTKRIESKRKLLPTLRGYDELARLDRSIHQLADELQRRSERERALMDHAALILCSCSEDFLILEVNAF